MGAAAKVVARRPNRRRGYRRYRTVLLFMAPWIIGFSVFILYPMVASLYYSFTKYDLLSLPVPIGLDNYRYMFTEDPRFWQSIGNTLWIIAIGVPLRIVLSVATASLLMRARRGAKFYRTIFFVPSIVPPVAAALAFVFVLNPATGPVNQLLSGVGVDNPPLWFFGAGWSKPAMLFLILWGIGDAIIIFLAGLLDVPKQLYEAADMEGASGWQKFRYVTLPMISPIIFFSLVIGVIQGFQFFSQAYVASLAVSGDTTTEISTALGTPEGSLLFYSIYLYHEGFLAFRMGYASAMAWVLFIITLVCTIAIIKSSRRWVHYQGGLQ